MVEDSTFVAPDCTMHKRFMRPGRMFTLRIRLTVAQVLTTKDVKATLAISRFVGSDSFDRPQKLQCLWEGFYARAHKQ